MKLDIGRVYRFEEGKLIQAKYNRFNRWSGFPDFVAFKYLDDDVNFIQEGKHSKGIKIGRYEVIGVECKSNGKLSKEERLKCAWLIKNNIFSKILIASKDNKKIKYEEF